MTGIKAESAIPKPAAAVIPIASHFVTFGNSLTKPQIAFLTISRPETIDSVQPLALSNSPKATMKSFRI